MIYIIQENLFKEYNYDKLIRTMIRHRFDFEIVKLNPKTLDFNIKSDRTDVFCFGAVVMAKKAANKGWKYGSMLDDNHDFDVYSKGFGQENMLNGLGFITDFQENLSFGDSDRVFIKPIQDNKAFTGATFTKESWKEFYNVHIKSKGIIKMSSDNKVLIAPIRKIQQEVRCWVVGGKVITSSLYKRGNDVIWLNYDNETFYTEFAQKMVDKHQVAEAFVIDVCLANDELKIVEVNNINSAGFYDCDINKLIQSIDDHFSQLYSNL